VVSFAQRSQLVIIESTFPVTTVIELEASISETHRRSVEATDHPVEQGADMTDHLRFKPRELDIVGVISNTPIKLLASVRATASVPGGDPRSRAEDAFAELERLMSTGSLCTLATTLVQYENMALVALTTPRDAARGNIAELQMTWREIRFAETLRIEAPVPVTAARSPLVKVGKQAAQQAKNVESEKAVSLLARLRTSLGF